MEWEYHCFPRNNKRILFQLVDPDFYKTAKHKVNKELLLHTHKCLKQDVLICYQNYTEMCIYGQNISPYYQLQFHYHSHFPGQLQLAGVPLVMFLHFFLTRTFRKKCHKIFMGQMPYLLPTYSVEALKNTH